MMVIGELFPAGDWGTISRSMPTALAVTRMPAFPVGGATFWGCLVGQPAVLHQLVGYDMAD